jgi:hypothetical protein
MDTSNVFVLLTCRLEVVVYALPLQDDEAREPVIHLRVIYDGWLPWKLTPSLYASTNITFSHQSIEQSYLGAITSAVVCHVHF